MMSMPSTHKRMRTRNLRSNMLIIVFFMVLPEGLIAVRNLII
jgi:hypothetical protein